MYFYFITKIKLSQFGSLHNIIVHCRSASLVILSYVPLEILPVLRFDLSQGCQQLDHVLIGAGIRGRGYRYRRGRNVKEIRRPGAVSQGGMVVPGVVVRCGAIVIVIRIVIGIINVRLAWIIILGRFFGVQLQYDVVYSHVKYFTESRDSVCIYVCITKIFRRATQSYDHVVKSVLSISDERPIRGNASVTSNCGMISFRTTIKVIAASKSGTNNAPCNGEFQ